MPKRYSTAEVLRVLYKAGFRQVSQRGSHIKLTDGEHVVIVPAGRKEIRPGTLNSILNQSGLSKEHFEG
jgi:predicted RNA binding protein YcfA (HicA-like mRNA interferase family)